MNGTFTILVRYCGGCNPEIDRGETVDQIAEILGEKAKWTYNPGDPADIILHVCGCAHACLDEKYQEPGCRSLVSVQGLRVNRQYADPGNLAAHAAEEILRAVSG